MIHWNLEKKGLKLLENDDKQKKTEKNVYSFCEARCKNMVFIRLNQIIFSQKLSVALDLNGGKKLIKIKIKISPLNGDFIWAFAISVFQ